MDEILHSVGISKRESAIYQSLLKKGPSSIRSVASDAGYNRGTTYETLKTLIKKGLVAYAPKGKVKTFAARNPYQLIRVAEEKQSSINNALDELHSSIVPHLQNQKSDTELADVRYYEGDDGIEQILHDVLNTPGNMYYVYSSKPVRKYLYRNFPQFTKQRIQKNKNVRVIAIGTGGEEAEKSERKWLTKNNSSTSTTYMIIYPPKYALISVSNEDYPYGVVIHEDQIANTQKMIFDALWETL